MLLAGSLVMLISMVITGILVALFHTDWATHRAAGWVCVGMCRYDKGFVQQLTLDSPDLGLHRRLRRHMGTSKLDARF